MNQMRKSFRELKKSMVAPVEADKQAYLSWVADLKSAAEASKSWSLRKPPISQQTKRPHFLWGTGIRWMS
jgi:hypothetical protein